MTKLEKEKQKCNIKGSRCEKYEKRNKIKSRINKNLLRQRTVAGYLNLRLRTGEEAEQE